MKRRKPRIHQSVRTKRSAKRAREAESDYWHGLARRFRKAGITGIDPTKPIQHRISFSVYEP